MKTLFWFRNALLFAALALLPGSTFAQFSIGISITTAPPPLPVYVQPPCPAPNYIWTPGYWAWGPYGYYWVPGTWVEAPSLGLYWTPGYWGWSDGDYVWNAGYWGPEVGFYGGVDYGYGYNGVGYGGGRWVGRHFDYNTAVVNVNRTVIHNTYVDRRVIVNRQESRVSFNGGRGGIQARPTRDQMTAEHSKRFGPVAAQTRQVNLARNNRENYAAVNKGLPPDAALRRPATSAADFSRATPARGARSASELRAAAANLKPVRPGANPGTRPATRLETKPGTRPATHAAPMHEARPATHPVPRTEARPATHVAPRHEVRPATHAAPKHEARPAPMREARPATHPAPRSEARPAPRPARRPEARPETRSAPTSEAHPAPRREVRPAPKPKAQPERRPHEEKPHGA